MQEKEFRFIISTDKLGELIELTEEPDLSAIVIKALALYYEILKVQTQGYKIGMIPTNTDSGRFDSDRGIIFINTDG